MHDLIQGLSTVANSISLFQGDPGGLPTVSRIVAGVGFTNQQDRFGAFEIAVPRPWRV